MWLILIALLLQWCSSSHGGLLIQKRSIIPSAARRSSFVHDGLVRPATSISTSSSSLTHDDLRESTVQVFLRCSPLIGGPSVLPLHVEVILAEDVETRRSIDNTIYIRKTNDLSHLMNTYPQLHRFDFLPENPKDPSTVLSLATFQAVPGKLRHRYYNTQNITSTDTTSTDGRGVTIVLPIGCITCQDEECEANSIISTAMKFTNERIDDVYDNLRIFLGKNCLSFALDLLANLDHVHGIQRVDRWSKIDFF
jgi:hypothetical protein